MFTEYITRKDGIEQCAECGKILSDYGVAHYPDCRFYTFEKELQDEEKVDEEGIPWVHVPTV